MLNKVCECCEASYAGGKEYGNYWCELSLSNVKPKGLCEFCNPNCEKWYVDKKKCHNNN